MTSPSDTNRTNLECACSPVHACHAHMAVDPNPAVYTPLINKGTKPKKIMNVATMVARIRADSGSALTRPVRARDQDRESLTLFEGIWSISAILSADIG